MIGIDTEVMEHRTQLRVQRHEISPLHTEDKELTQDHVSGKDDGKDELMHTHVESYRRTNEL